MASKTINYLLWKHHATNEQKIIEKETSGLAENRLFPFYYKIPRFLRTLRVANKVTISVTPTTSKLSRGLYL